MSTPIETEESIRETGEVPPAEQPIEEIAPPCEPEQPAAEKSPQQDYSDRIDPRDRDFIAAIDRILERQNKPRPEPEKPQEPPIEKFALGVVKKGVGVISLALILVLMGAILIWCMFSGTPDYMMVVKLAPVAAVLVGLELLVHYFTSGKHFRVHIPSICISALLVVGCCYMATTLNKSYSESKKEYNNRSVAAEIYDHSYKELRYLADIKQLTVEVELNPDGTSKEKGFEALSTDDVVNITVDLGGSYSSPQEFAEDCKKIIDGYRILSIPITNYSFSCNTKFNSFNLDVVGKFEQDYSEKRLAEQVRYFMVEDYDYIDDLEDFVADDDESSETSENDFDL